MNGLKTIVTSPVMKEAAKGLIVATATSAGTVIGFYGTLLAIGAVKVKMDEKDKNTENQEV